MRKNCCLKRWQSYLYKKISDTLISGGRKISPNTVDAYLKALTDSYILYKADRYGIKGRQCLKILGKYYFMDSGIRNHIISQSAKDLGHLLENVVYLELFRRKNRVNGRYNAILSVHRIFIKQELFNTDIVNAIFIVPRNDVILDNNNLLE